MDDIPQGGSGGVPGHHDGDSDFEDQQGSDEQDRRVKTVRAGVPVAEQKAEQHASEEGGDQEE